MSRQYQYDYNLGSLDSTPKHQRTYLKQGLYENDVYKFNISSTRNLNLFLNDISAGDDADLYLYRDSNNNGFLDEIDTLIERPYRGGNANEWINVQAEAGTYFARVNLYSGGSDRRIDYDLDLSATPINPSPPEDPSKAPNLLPKEIELGDIRLGTILLNDPNHSRTINQSGDISNSDTVDTYHFTASSRGDGVGIRVSLTGLSNDADVRLIEDRDRDGIVDQGEVIQSSALGSTSNESFEITRSNSSLSQYDYFIQVYQFSGNTNYNLNMTFTSTLM
ncbi:hypothetical protein NIES2119_04905 [[Phormidium ambiguum] IAM M-71]|uniref:Peptidase C-terminal archaeal/bacterial domain-containing protein n=1 Tax=[Phormidium ambiguum] IAM M-71 TaxID=454136 RepID=A0A1U7IR16_9CYAN|nr:hypothetical protein NIES2119_04905 [Phormidium ambiguum IAM M-71]